MLRSVHQGHCACCRIINPSHYRWTYDKLTVYADMSNSINSNTTLTIYIIKCFNCFSRPQPDMSCFVSVKNCLMKAKHYQSLNYFCSWMSFKNKCTTHFNLIRMSPDRIRSPCFASQLGFSSICAIFWVTSGFTDLKKHCGCCCSRTKRECHWKSLKAALHLCAYLLSLLNLFFKIESEMPSIISYLELKT